MKLEDEVPGGDVAHVLHAVRFAGDVVDDVVRLRPRTDRLDLSGEDDDRDVIRVGMRQVAVAGLENGDVRVKLSEMPGRSLEQPRRCGRVEQPQEAPRRCGRVEQRELKGAASPGSAADSLRHLNTTYVAGSVLVVCSVWKK